MESNETRSPKIKLDVLPAKSSLESEFSSPTRARFRARDDANELVWPWTEERDVGDDGSFRLAWGDLTKDEPSPDAGEPGR